MRWTPVRAGQRRPALRPRLVGTRPGLALFLALLALIAGGFRALAASEADSLATLRPEHPRLYADDAELARIKQGIASDPRLKAWYDRLQAQARDVLDDEPVRHVLIGPRLLDQSRRALQRISLLAGLYRLDGDRAKLDRAVKEMRTAAAFPDWNPSHFLDVAEMTNALAIGYDWLYPVLEPADRDAVRKAIVELGLKPGLEIYEAGRWWSKADHNWNQVCNGGMVAGALAVASEEPELARKIVDHSRVSIVLAMKSFAPDGGWEEGPGYWNYATIYNAYYLSAVQSALGTDFELTRLPGFAVTGGFRAQSVGPLGLTFNYADAGDRAGTAPQMLWLARQFDRPGDALHELSVVGRSAGIFHLFWSGGTLPPADAVSERPLDAVYRGINVAFFRSAWDDPKALYVGFKGGDNKANHSHLDLGTFVLDAGGRRWAVDLGGDEYNLPGYFGKNRWEYYRLRTEGHNTITMDGANQDPKAAAPILAFQSTPSKAFTVADLSAGYAPKLRRAWRGVAVLDRARVLIQDEFEAEKAVDIVWNLQTPSKIELDGAVAHLRQERDRLEARILEPSGARFETSSANPSSPPGQRRQPDVTRLQVRLPAASGRTRLAIVFEPPGVSKPVVVEPLSSWVAAGRLPAAAAGE